MEIPVRYIRQLDLSADTLWITISFLNIRTPKKFVVITLKFELPSPNDADGMANIVDPDRAVWSGSEQFAQNSNTLYKFVKNLNASFMDTIGSVIPKDQKVTKDWIPILRIVDCVNLF